MAHHIIVTDRNRGDLEGERPGGTHGVTVDDATTMTVGLGSAHQGFPRSGHTSVGRTVLVEGTISGSIGAQAEGIVALPGRTAEKCGCFFPRTSGSHGQATDRPQGEDGSGSGAVAVGDCSTGNVTTAVWGAKRLGRRGSCSPVPEPFSMHLVSSTPLSSQFMAEGYTQQSIIRGFQDSRRYGRLFA